MVEIRVEIIVSGVPGIAPFCPSTLIPEFPVSESVPRLGIVIGRETIQPSKDCSQSGYPIPVGKVIPLR